MNFISLDFETANHSRVSICAAGLAVFENGDLAEAPYWLVRPPKGHGWFHETFIACHGLTHLDVLAAPEFPAIAPEILTRLTRAELVIAHNATFDIEHLRATLDHFSLPRPEFDYVCTCQLARRVWPDLPSHSLDSLTAHIGHPFNHHHAQSDAEATGRVLLAMMQQVNASTPRELLQKAGMEPKHFYQQNKTSRRENDCQEPAEHVSTIIRMSPQPTYAECQMTEPDCAALLQRIEPLALEYEANLKKRDINIGFNLFELISDHYYRETFHSDILRALLDPKGKHQEGNKYLELFLKFIKSHNAEINLSDYSKAEVVTEEGRIDILIKSQVGAQSLKHAIIIENKINGAGDQYKQLPGYLKKVTANNYVCDAIIYLRLNGYAGPDMKGWNEFEPQLIEELNRKLIKICAYDGTEKDENDLRKGWILKCERESRENSDAQHILRQYGKIIEKLGGNIMNKPVMEKFYKLMVEGENLKTAMSLKPMLDGLIFYRRDRIIDEFKNCPSPFDRVFPHADGALFGKSFGEAYFEMKVWVGPDSYLFQFQGTRAIDANGQAEKILKGMGIFHEYTFDVKNGIYARKSNFSFPSEEENLFDYISTFKKKLGETLDLLSRPIP